MRGESKRQAGSRGRRGFVLLLSLMLIALVGILLVGLARHSLAIAMEGEEARIELQRRWGIVFLSRALLSDPELLLSRRLGANASQAARLPIAETLELGQLAFRVTLDDENRKLNINRLRVAGGTRQVLRTIRRFGGGKASVQLQPMRGSPLAVREFDSWGHVLNIAASSDAEHRYGQIEQLSHTMTCWGNAKINVRRCDNAVLLRAGTLAVDLTTATRLVALRENDPQLDTDALLAKLATNRRKQALLKGWLCDKSDCYSLWILTSGPCASLDQFVRENADSESQDLKHYRW